MVPVSADGFSNRIRTVDWDIFFNVAKGCRMVCIPLGMKTVKKWSSDNGRMDNVRSFCDLVSCRGFAVRGFNLKNLRDGRYEEFYSNGKIKTLAQYENGKLESLSRWKPDGSACPHSRVMGGAGLVVDYQEDGSVDSNHSYAHGGIRLRIYGGSP